MKRIIVSGEATISDEDVGFAAEISPALRSVLNINWDFLQVNIEPIPDAEEE